MDHYIRVGLIRDSLAAFSPSWARIHDLDIGPRALGNVEIIVSEAKLEPSAALSYYAPRSDGPPFQRTIHVLLNELARQHTSLRNLGAKATGFDRIVADPDLLVGQTYQSITLIVSNPLLID